MSLQRLKQIKIEQIKTNEIVDDNGFSKFVPDVKDDEHLILTVLKNSSGIQSVYKLNDILEYIYMLEERITELES